MVNIAIPRPKTGIRGQALPQIFKSSNAARRLSAAIAIATAGLVAAAPVANANPKMVVDVKTGKVISHQEAFRKWYPASLTKLMTAYIAFSQMKAGKISPQTEVVMSKKAADQPASKMYFKPGQKLTMDSALKLLLIKSANDIAVAIAETIGGTSDNFVAQMNAQAQRLGMSNSHFMNATGLPNPEHYSSAADMAKLARAIVYWKLTAGPRVEYGYDHFTLMKNRGKW